MAEGIFLRTLLCSTISLRAKLWTSGIRFLNRSMSRGYSGGDFLAWLGARREHSRSYGDDEQRRLAGRESAKIPRYLVPESLILSIILAACTSTSTTPGESLDFELNEKVVFMGNAFFENSIYHGEIETTFSLCFPEKNITFRNIGVSGAEIMFMHTHAHGHVVADDLEILRKDLTY